jgi:hypothetical protein
MEKKISQLTAKGANLASTDLLEISEVTADGYASKYVTGAEIIGAIPISETNPSTIGTANGTAITGTTIQISASVLIPAGTLVANNTIYIKAFINKTAGTGVTTPRYYVNTANTLTGATLLGAGGGMSTSVYFQRFERNIFFDGTNLNSFLAGTSAANDYTLSGITLTAFNPLVDNYLIFAISNGTTTPDNGNFKRVIVQKYD